jgi:hypothetical protein
MATATVEEIYERHVKPLTTEQRLRLVSIITGELAASVPEERPKKRNLMELHGLGKEIWGDMDAQEYVNELRREWDHRP